MFADLYGEEYYGVGDEFRYRPDRGHRRRPMPSRGYVDRRSRSRTTRDRWKMSLDHESRDISAACAAWSRTATIRTSSSSGISSANVNEVTLRTSVLERLPLRQLGAAVAQRPARRPRETFIARRSSDRHPAPAARRSSIACADRSSVGSPLYLELLASATYFEVDRPTTVTTAATAASISSPSSSLPLRAGAAGCRCRSGRRPRHLVRRQLAAPMSPATRSGALRRRGPV